MGYSVAGKNLMLNAFKTSCTYVSLHSAYPGESGENELSGGSYARKPAVLGTPVNGSMVHSEEMLFSVPAGYVRYAGYWTALNGGTLLGFGTVTEQNFAAAGLYRIVSGAIELNPISAILAVGGGITGGEATIQIIGSMTYSMTASGGALGGGIATIAADVAFAASRGGLSGGQATAETEVAGQYSMTATGGALAGAVGVSEKVAAWTSASGSLGGGAATIETSTAGGSVFSDDFTGSNGSNPNGTKWPTIYGEDSSTDVEIQNNALRLTSHGTVDEEEYPVIDDVVIQSSTITGGSHTISVDVVTFDKDQQNYADLYVVGSGGSAEPGSPISFAFIRFNGSAIQVYSYNGSGEISSQLASGTLSGSGPWTIEATTSGTNSLDVFVNSTRIGSGTLTATCTWGSNITIALANHSGTSDHYADFDNVDVQ